MKRFKADFYNLWLQLAIDAFRNGFHRFWYKSNDVYLTLCLKHVLIRT